MSLSPRLRAPFAAIDHVFGILVVPLAMLLAALLLRALGFTVAVIDTDEGLYLVQAQSWLRGHWPLVEVWDMHPVGAPAMFAAAMAVFGESIATIRLLGCICVALAGWAIYGAMRVAGGPRGIGLAAGFIYVAHSLRMGGLATNTEILFAPMVTGAMALGIRGTAEALRRGQGPGWPSLIAMGLAIGAALSIKPVMVVEGCLAFALLVFPALWRRVLPWGRALAMAAAYAGLCALPTILFGLLYWSRGELPAFLDGTFLAPLRYAGGRLGPVESFHRVLVEILTLLWPFLLAGIALLRWLPRPGIAGTLARIGLIWFLAASLGVASPGYFYPHYFLLWLPPLAILATLGCWWLARWLPPHRRAAGFALLVAVVMVGSWRADATARVDRGIGLFEADPVIEISRMIRAELKPGETIFVANYHPVIYALTDAALPTRFIFPAQLTGEFTEVAGINTDDEVARIMASRPRFVVVDRGWWPRLRESAAAIIAETLESDYHQVGEVPEERGPIELWAPK
ncbi:glycosyltransferase family 39 protein [Belnapia rosea]|uniref:4-amino-4-deoxy-L-arabinose transferase n=1 Tax=Belnapia rosea TaxID=938405 RepID=A0A1G6TFW5_9PROT|nr:glycosyltransferase family 39 protein [Belnapia rosea]SDB68735.1 4-amino-4-deoxy-L-arabinose transferase [Belnapia rosea]SDD27953.1 4-amino-4-deoxy-L-arabinose transferase [Belnapia rosea]